MRPSSPQRYNRPMRPWAIRVVLIIIGILITIPANPAPAQPAPPSVTVPFALDQGRVVIDVDLLLPNGSTERVRAWVDNGNPDLYMNQRVARLLGLGVSCHGQICAATPPTKAAALEILIGGVKISLNSTTEIKVPASTSAVAPGMSAEINIPSTVLRNYEVLFNFPDHEFTIAQPGHLKFNGVPSKMLVNPSNGLIQIPSRIENKNYDLGLDLGSSVNSLSQELFDKLSSAHPDWPHMTGAVGPFDMGDSAIDTKSKVMRVARVQYGPLFLTDIAVTNIPQNQPTVFDPRPGDPHPGTPTAGWLSSEALMNYRIGLDYPRAAVYFDIGRTIHFPDFDVVGLILRPEGDSSFIIDGIADFDGNPSVPDGAAGVQPGDRLIAVGDTPIADFTLGQVWSLLQGSPGQERKLTIERTDKERVSKQFTVVAQVQHFLGDPSRNDEEKRKSKKN